MYKRIAMLALVGVSLTGCASMKDWFTSDKAKAKKASEPAELVKFDASIELRRLWSASVGKGEGRIGIAQAPVVADGVVYAAALEGGVHALDLNTGKSLWHWRPEKVKDKPALRLSGGPGVGGGLVVIGSLDGEALPLRRGHRLEALDLGRKAGGAANHRG